MIGVSMAPGRCGWTNASCRTGCPFFKGGCQFAQAKLDDKIDLVGATRIVNEYAWYLGKVSEALKEVAE